MKNFKWMMVTFVCLGIISCEKASEEAYLVEEGFEEIGDLEIAELDSAAQSSMLTSMAANYQDSVRLFYRSSDLRFETRNAYDAILSIENKVEDFKGFVNYSNVSQMVLDSDPIALSQDSLMLLEKIERNGQINLRLPYEKLSEFLLSLEDEVFFLNHRSIVLEDVSFDYEAQKMGKERQDKTLKGLGEIPSNSQTALEKSQLEHHYRASKDRGMINSKKLLDKIRMADVQISLHEPPRLEKRIIPNTNVEDYERAMPFLLSLNKSWNTSWFYLKESLLFLVSIFPVLLLLGTLYLFMKKSINWLKD